MGQRVEGDSQCYSGQKAAGMELAQYNSALSRSTHVLPDAVCGVGWKVSGKKPLSLRKILLGAKGSEIDSSRRPGME